VKKKIIVQEERRKGVDDALKASKEEIVKLQAQVEDLLKRTRACCQLKRITIYPWTRH